MTSTAAVGGAQDRERAARVAVLGLADRAAVDEQHAAVVVHPRLVGVPEDEHLVGLGAGEALVEAGGLVLEEVLVDLARRAVDEMDAVLADREAQVEGQLAHEVLGALVGVRERPVDRLLAELAVVRGDVRAAAVLEVAGDRVVVVAVDRRDLALGDQRAHLVGMRAVADQVAAAVDALDPELVDARERGLQRGQVGVDVGDDGDGVGHGFSVRRSERTGSRSRSACG